MVKKGFSLIEALVVMGIVSVFFAAATKVVTQKPRDIKYNQPHGYYECYYQSMPNPPFKYKQKYVREGIESDIESVDQCSFNPPIGAGSFNIIIKSDNAGFYHSSFQPVITNNIKFKINIIPYNGFFTIDSIELYDKNDPEVKLKYDDGNESSQTIENLLKTLHPESKLNNLGDGLGILISW